MEYYTLKQTSSSIDHVWESNNVLFYFIFIPMVRDGKAIIQTNYNSHLYSYFFIRNILNFKKYP